MLYGIGQSISIFFGTLTAALLMHPGAMEWIVRVFLVVVTWWITYAALYWLHGNKRASIFQAERNTARAALAELQIKTDRKVNAYRDGAMQTTAKAVLAEAKDMEGREA